jgi:hypothetical protein
MLHMELHFHSFKIQMTQELLPRDLNVRRDFCTKLLEMMDTIAISSKRDNIRFSPFSSKRAS